MSYSPVELRHVRIGRRPFGYNRGMVEQVIEEVAESFEATWRERGELADQVDALQKQVVELKRREDLLTHTLVAAEQAAADVRDHAKRSAEATLTEAENEARSITRAAQAERDRLLLESRHIAAMLRAALSMVDGEAEAAPGGDAGAGAGDAGGPDAEAQPDVELLWRREDTREFEPISLPPIQDLALGDDDPEPRPLLRRLSGGGGRDLDWGD